MIIPYSLLHYNEFTFGIKKIVSTTIYKQKEYSFRQIQFQQLTSQKITRAGQFQLQGLSTFNFSLYSEKFIAPTTFIRKIAVTNVFHKKVPNSSRYTIHLAQKSIIRIPIFLVAFYYPSSIIIPSFFWETANQEFQSTTNRHTELFQVNFTLQKTF